MKEKKMETHRISVIDCTLYINYRKCENQLLGHCSTRLSIIQFW